MKKLDRQEKILEIIRDNNISNQKELINYLENAGFNVTQATISRDIKELQLIKVPLGNGISIFKTSQNQTSEMDSTLTLDYLERVETIFQECVTDIVSNEFLIIIKTLPGMAQAAAHAIDTLSLRDILGTIAGDDTIFIALRDGCDKNKLLREFRQLLKRTQNARKY